MRQEALSNERSTMSSPGHGYFRIEESAHCGHALLLDDLPRFQQEAPLALDVQPHWMDVLVAGPNGGPLMSARAPLPSALPADDLAGVEQVAHSLRPAIGDVSRSDASGIPVRVPVLRNGTLIYVITVLVRPASGGLKEQKR
jgi:hypothetical protein